MDGPIYLHGLARESIPTSKTKKKGLKRAGQLECSNASTNVKTQTNDDENKKPFILSNQTTGNGFFNEDSLALTLELSP